MVKKSFRLVLLFLVASLFACASPKDKVQVESNSAVNGTSVPSQSSNEVASQPQTTEQDISFQPYSKEQSAGYVDYINNVPAQPALTLPAGQAITLSGWAILPGATKPADKVIVTLGDEKIVTPTEVAVQDRPDIVKAFKNDNLAKSGWAATIDSTKLSGNQVSLQVWSYDAATKKAYPINEPITVTIK